MRYINKDTFKFLIALAILFGIGAACCNSDKTSSEKEKINMSPDIVVSATTLFNDYQANEVSADNRYKDKILQVTGSVQSIDKEFTDDIIVRLKTSNEFMSVDCYIDKSYSSKASSLSKGNSVSVIGKCTGIILGSPIIKDCSIK